MGRPQADPYPSYHNGQPQSQQPTSDPPQPQEYHYDQQVTEDVPPPPFEAYTDENHQESHQRQHDSSDQNESTKQNQEPFQPQSPPPQQQQTYPPYPPQPQAAAQPPPVRFPPQFPQANNASQPVSYPPRQNPQMVMPRTPPRNFPPQPESVQFPPKPSSQPAYHQASEPVQFPPPPSQATYQASEPVQFPPQPPSQSAYHQVSEPVQFPPPPSQATYQASEPVQFPPPPFLATYHQQQVQFQPSPAKFQQQQQMGAQTGYSAMPPSLLTPAAQTNGVASWFPVQNQYPVPQVGTEGWRAGLFDCMDDPLNALMTFCFPCLTFGQIAEIIDNGHTSCGTSGMLYGLIAFAIGMPCLMSCSYRTKLRSRYGLVESPAPDWITHCFCEYCALCQEYRELQHRGLDPSIVASETAFSAGGRVLSDYRSRLSPQMVEALMISRDHMHAITRYQNYSEKERIQNDLDDISSGNATELSDSSDD